MNIFAEESHGNRGQVVVEHVLVLPIALAMIISVVAFAALGTRGIVAQLAVMRAARVAAVFQEELVGGELYASLHPSLFGAHAFAFDDGSGASRRSNDIEGHVRIYAAPSDVLNGGATGVPSVTRSSPVTPALPEGLGDSALRGGDIPSPYCSSEGGYSACGYPE